MRQVAARPDPDAAPRLVTLPVSWDDRAAEALARLVPGDGPVHINAASSVWLGMIEAKARQAGTAAGLVTALFGLLRQRRACPVASVWACAPGVPGFVVHTAGFYDPEEGFDIAAFAAGCAHVAQACQLLAPSSPSYEIGLAGLDDLLACLGIPYDSARARDVGACLAALLRASVERALEGNQRDLLATPAQWPAPPKRCAIPGLAEAAASARLAVSRAPDAVPATGVFAAGPAEALLGVETGGIAPAFSPVRDVALTRAAQNRLAAAALSPEAALAAILVGEAPLPVAGPDAYAAMHAAVAPYLERMPAVPAALPGGGVPAPAPSIQRARSRPLPARRGGLTQKVLVGGRRLFLRTGEYADGSLGEITLNLPKESQAVRNLAECFAQAVSLGLQHGVPLEEFVEAFAHTSFGPAGAVEGDADVARASSVLDYVFRSLSANYLGRALPEPEIDDEVTAVRETAPLLPLDLPRGDTVRARRRALRLVA